ncbi:siroheme synthase CysG [Mesobacterium pallidum]|uniref:siroheme synthase CysG n=1 Tax=Mesobacterium pallidum TaxID=2872037 RepID=UPI001EE18391|nr:siroheme synthase CysG [Mesobacterium pallidum]
MDYLPIFLDLKGRKVLIDGGTAVAARRAARVLEAGGEVVICDSDPGPEVQALRGAVTRVARAAEPGDLVGCVLAYGASRDPERDAALRASAKVAGVLSNIADITEAGDFVVPSIVDRAPITVAITTGGAAPPIARILRARIEATLPRGFGALGAFMGRFKDQIAAAIPDGKRRRRFYEGLIEGPAGDFFLAGDEMRAEQQIAMELGAGEGTPAQGEVYLVGAGPGDPDLLTFKALRLMQRADVVLYDALVSPAIMDLVSPDAKRVYVGKRRADHAVPQEGISEMLVRLAQEGNRVLRLKGGDPFIFGRGGEEIARLAEAGIGFQVVPGITAAAGCGAYAGIPLTHRDHAQSAVFVTGHGKDGMLELDWQVLIRKGQTAAIYMGLGNLPALIDGFLTRGVPADMPVAVIENGTLPTQKVATGTLADIEGAVADQQIKGPAVIIVGSVVRLRDTLNWVHHRSEARGLDVVPEASLGV